MFVKSFIHSLKTGIWYFVWEFTVYTCAYKLFCFNFLFLWRESGRKLATKIEYRMLSDVFGLGCSIVREIVFKTCKAIPFHLLFEYAHIPSGEKLREIADGSEFNWSFSRAASAIDGSHVPIVRLDECFSDYYNCKGYYSIVVQGLVDYFRGVYGCMYWLARKGARCTHVQ